MLQGLPASGKSTWAEEYCKNNPNAVRLTKDLLRTMLNFDNFNYRNEKDVVEVEKLLAIDFIMAGREVIIDDTNFNPKIQNIWIEMSRELNCPFELVDFSNTVSVETCLERDKYRLKKVGGNVITKMALQYLDHLEGQEVVVCDLDGTLCDVEHRRHLVRGEGKKDWDSFFSLIPSDTLIESTLNMLNREYHEGKKIILVSARPEKYRDSTEAWLQRYLSWNNFKYETLIMREDGDTRPDTMVKSDIFNKYLKHLNIIRVYDDRPSVIRMWRELGLEVIDVGNGEEF